MDSNIIDGKALALNHEQALQLKITTLKIKPHVVSILVGDNPSSVLYSGMKKQKAESLGLSFTLKHFSENIPFEQVAEEIKDLNNNPEITGIMIQLPLPKSFLGDHKPMDLVDLILPEKDVDGLTSKGPVLPATIRGILSIFDSENIELLGKNIVVLGANGMVGRDLMAILKDKMGYNVAGVNRQTEGKETLIKQADILIAATGQSNLVTGEMVKDGVVVIDVGRDIDFESVLKVASKITPPKGGVGPMTVISLMENAVDLSLQNG